MNCFGGKNEKHQFMPMTMQLSFYDYVFNIQFLFAVSFIKLQRFGSHCYFFNDWWTQNMVQFYPPSYHSMFNLSFIILLKAISTSIWTNYFALMEFLDDIVPDLVNLSWHTLFINEFL